ncbi:hypothetical protein [Streptomyces mangrovisoli]|uniref:Uncharacterized protein n=1 Tax=Streptomyces mangrovisoli TaxID=1428628 RepID=A0A1J4NKX4_9ACTN|nr:hypothetical protein [Streptomyces mangrovisoli]OIJ62818.1 hypothetical protein WN71_037440 [Streptomyces mangrovisoli]
MTEDARREIASALAADDGGAETALRVLGLAIGWAAAAVRRVEGGAAGADALETVFAFDDALTRTPELAAALPALLAAARPGATVAEHVARRTGELTAAAERVAAARAEADGLRDLEQRVTERLAEHRELHAKVTELRRLARLVEALDELRGQQEDIDACLRALRGQDTGVEETLRRGSDNLVRLSENRLSALMEPTREALVRAADAQRRLAYEEAELIRGRAELAAAVDKLEEIRRERGAQLAGLRRYAEATRDIALALAGPGGAAGEFPAGGRGWAPGEFGTWRKPDAPDSVGAPDAPVEYAAPGESGAPGRSGEPTLKDLADTADAIARRLLQADNTLRSVLAERDAAETDGRRILHRTGD